MDSRQRLVDAAYADEAEGDRIHEELGRLLPDPAWSDLVYWPAQHPKSASLAPNELTPETIVDFAMEYRPIAL
jgi:hypothetical protein